MLKGCRKILLRIAFCFVLGVPEPVVEKDPLSQECKWLILTFSERRFFALPMPELLELVMAAKYLDIPLLVHYACQAVAARIKGKSPPEICKVLQQDCDLEEARIKEIRADNPWLSSVSSGARIEVSVLSKVSGNACTKNILIFC